MVYLRIGTRLLFLRAASPDDTCSQLSEKLQLPRVSLDEGLRESDENTTLIFVTPTGLEITDPEDARGILMARGSGTTVLSHIINEGLSGIIDRVDMGPRILLMRVPEHEEAVLDALAKDYQAQTVSWHEGVRLGEKDQTLLGVTTHRLNQALGEQAVYPRQLLIDQPLHECYAQLRREALLYITHTLKVGAWYEYRINLYDNRGQYELHYHRLIHVIAALELGFILGESWTRDHALTLLAVMAYQVRLFSFLPPEAIKKILMGLEYSDEGKRLADFDLYYRNRKVGWTETLKDKTRSNEKRNKQEEGQHRRQELLDKLSIKERERLFRLETELQPKK